MATPAARTLVVTCVLVGAACGSDQLNRVPQSPSLPAPEVEPPPPSDPLAPLFLTSVSFESANVVVPEDVGAAGAVVRVLRTGDDLSQPSFVMLTITGGTAVASVHFVPVGFTIGASVLTRRVDFPGVPGTAQLVDVSLSVLRVPGVNGDKTITFALSEPGPGVELVAPASAALTIRDVDVVPPPPDGDTDLQGNPIPDYEPIGRYFGSSICEFPGFPPTPGAGGYSPCGSWAISPQICSLGMTGPDAVTEANMFVLEDLFQGNSHYGNDVRFGLRPNQAFVLKFRTGGPGSYEQLSSLPDDALGYLQFAMAGQTSRGSDAVRFATLSTEPCDFDQEPGREYEKFDAGDPCYKRIMPSTGVMYAYVMESGTAGGPYCTLRPNTTYYLNMRWEDPEAARHEISCVGNEILGTCGTSLAIH